MSKPVRIPKSLFQPHGNRGNQKSQWTEKMLRGGMPVSCFYTLESKDKTEGEGRNGVAGNPLVSD